MFKSPFSQGAREGHMFNEQNFHQRAAKTDAGQLVLI